MSIKATRRTSGSTNDTLHRKELRPSSLSLFPAPSILSNAISPLPEQGRGEEWKEEMQPFCMKHTADTHSHVHIKV